LQPFFAPKSFLLVSICLSYTLAFGLLSMFILYFFSMVGPACPAIALAAAEGIPKVLSVFPERSDLTRSGKNSSQNSEGGNLADSQQLA
jgi:hypothetical protein